MLVTHPPKHRPRPRPRHWPHTLDKQFAAGPFDPRMVKNNATRDLTSLGIVVECWWWYRTHRNEVGEAFAPMYESMYQLLRRECPDVVEELEKHEASNRST